jgi:hypothetical protein
MPFAYPKKTFYKDVHKHPATIFDENEIVTDLVVIELRDATNKKSNIYIRFKVKAIIWVGRGQRQRRN